MKSFSTVLFNCESKYCEHNTSKNWRKILLLFIYPFDSQDLISNSPYCLLYSSYDVSSKNLELDQLISL